MKRLWSILVAVMVVTGLTWGCSDPTSGGDTGRKGTPADVHAEPDRPLLYAAYTPKYNVANCPGGTNPVEQLIQHGEVWSGAASTGWLQWAVSPLEANAEREAAVEVYSIVNGVRCRNVGKSITWTFYDGPSQVPTNTTIQYLDGFGLYVRFNPSAFTHPGDGNEYLTSDGLWEIGRDHWIASATPKQLSNGSIVLGASVADTLIVDAVITYPAGCQPNTGVNCQP